MLSIRQRMVRVWVVIDVVMVRKPYAYAIMVCYIYLYYQYLFVNTIYIAKKHQQKGIFLSAELVYYAILTVCSLPISLLTFSVINVLIYFWQQQL